MKKNLAPKDLTFKGKNILKENFNLIIITNLIVAIMTRIVIAVIVVVIKMIIMIIRITIHITLKLIIISKVIIINLFDSGNNDKRHD